MMLSIVATLYHSAAYIHEFYTRCTASARLMAGDDYEIILVNDGSPDDSMQRAAQLAQTDPHVTLIDLSRNFGHHKAMMTGLSHAKGQYIFLIDSDLEEEPEILISFYNQMQQQSCDVVYGVQAQRKGDWFERCSGRWFYKIFRWFTGFTLPENMTTARLMTRRYVDALLQHKERELFLAGIWHITGFTQLPQVIVKHHTSQTTYTLQKKMALLVDSITSFSNGPLIGIFYIGILISVVALMYIGSLLFQWTFLSKPPSGWTSVIASVWMLGGLMISFIGVVGIYLAKIFSETKQRPYAIIRHIYRKDES